MVVVVVLALAAVYRSFGSAETGTGNLTLPPPEPNENQNARNFEAVDVEGNPFELTDEGTYVLAFWSSLNENSNEAQPGFEKLAREYGDEEDVTFAVVYVNSAPKDGDAPYIVLQPATGRLTSLYNVKRVPRLFVIDEGKIAFPLDGYYDGYQNDLEEELDAALEEDRNRTG